MEQILKHFGKGMITGVVSILLVVLFFYIVRDEVGNRGILPIIGGNVTEQTVDYGTYADYGRVIQEGEKERPQLQINSELIPINAGIAFGVKEYIQAVHWTQERMDIKILDICDNEENTMMSFYNMETGEIIFPKSGIYVVKISVKDETNRKTVYETAVPVGR